MKKILIAIALAMVIAVFTLIEDPNAQQEQALASMYDNVIIKNADNAVQQCTDWQQTLLQAREGERSEQFNQSFAKLVMAWKAVEATYIAGELDQDAIDYPRYLDIFKVGNESIIVQMDKVLKSHSAPQTALYKHSYKTLNALEAVLYSDNQLTERKLALAQEISTHICERFNDIAKVYQQQRSAFLSAKDTALSMLANVLANQTLSLKDWRIGDVAGLTKKYENQPDVRRSEYYLSYLTLDAIKTILQTQNQLIGKQDYPNFAQIADIYGAQKPLNEARLQLTSALTEVEELMSEKQDISQQNSRKLYQSVGKLQLIYYNDLIKALPVMAKILEADSD